jgi:aminoglycoside phosphotransferase (APT) family kinase protein
LASYAVPHTLVHGDLHLGNVARCAGSYLFFDWTDACVAHPFFDTISIFQAKDPNVLARLRNSYLGVWAAYEPIERLLEAWTLAKPLCPAPSCQLPAHRRNLGGYF